MERIVLLVTLVCLGWACPIYNNPVTGLQYDITGLRSYIVDWYYHSPEDGDFYINFCTPTIKACRQTVPDAVCNYQGSGLLSSYNFGDVASASFSPNGLSDGLILTYNTTDTVCGQLKHPLSTEIHISCGTSKGKITKYQRDGCTYIFGFSSYHGCGTKVNPSPSPIIQPTVFSFPSASPLPSPAAPQSPETLPKLPGVEKTGSGYNLLAENHVSPLQIGSETLGQVFEDYTYNQNLTWAFSSGQRYAIPDQLHISRAQSFGVKSYTYQSVGAYLTEEGDNMGLNLEHDFKVSVWGNITAKIPVGVSALLSNTNQQMKAVGSVLIVANENVPLYDIQQFPGRGLSTDFVEAVQKLDRSTSSRTDLENFLELYGSHVQSTVEMGGRFTIFGVVTGEQSAFASSTTIQAGLRVSFLDLTGSLGGWSGINKNTPASYTKELQKYWVGGIIPSTPYEKWVESVPQYPGAIGRRLSSIIPYMSSVSSTAADRYLKFLRDKFEDLNHPIYEAENNSPQLPYSMESAHYPDAAMISIGYFVDDDDDCQSCLWNVQSTDSKPTNIQYKKPGMISWKRQRTFGITPYDSTSVIERVSPPLRTKAISQGNFQCGMYPCIPGLDTLGVGYDIITGASALPSHDWTFHEGNTWKSPYTGEVYAYPDQVVLEATSASQESNRLFKSYSEFCMNTTDASAPGWDGHFFQLGREAESIRRAFDGSQSVLGLVEESYISYSLSLEASSVYASQRFNESVAQLPRIYDPDVYFRFLSDWGTHFSSYASYGGKAKMYSFIDQDFFTSNSAIDIETQLGAQYHGWKVGLEWGSLDSSSTAEFSSESFQWVSFFGGDATLALTSQWSEWIQTTRSAPAQVFKTLIPIWEIQQLDTGIASNLERAVHDYYAMVNNINLPSPVYLAMSLQYNYEGSLISTYGSTCHFAHGLFDGDEEIFASSYKNVGWSFYAPKGYQAPGIKIHYEGTQYCGSYSGYSYCPANSYIGGGMYTNYAGCETCSTTALKAEIKCYSLQVVL